MSKMRLVLFNPFTMQTVLYGHACTYANHAMDMCLTVPCRILKRKFSNKPKNYLNVLL